MMITIKNISFFTCVMLASFQTLAADNCTRNMQWGYVYGGNLVANVGAYGKECTFAFTANVTISGGPNTYLLRGQVCNVQGNGKGCPSVARCFDGVNFNATCTPGGNTTFTPALSPSAAGYFGQLCTLSGMTSNQSISGTGSCGSLTVTSQ